MAKFLYTIATKAYFLGIKLAAFWNEKARRWVAGRVGVWEALESKFSDKRIGNQQVVWMHCASLGEFEQGRPVLEALRQKHPSIKILLTFFSPSGYEIRKNYPIVDYVAYLPTDTAANAQRFLSIVNPAVAIFVKYEFWYHYLATLKQHKIPTILISAIFRSPQPFFKWYGSLYREMLHCFTTIFVQDEASKALLVSVGISQVHVGGDTRVDRVAEIAANPMDLPAVAKFCGGAPVLVCGSTWPQDEALLYGIFSHERFKGWKFILAPHDVQPSHLQAIEGKMNVPFVRYSQLSTGNPSNATLLLVDNIGLLSALYAFGKIAYVGGGFGQSIHSTLEPAAHGLPVVFGPKHEKFSEAVWLKQYSGGFVVKDGNELLDVLTKLQNGTIRDAAAAIALKYIEERKGTSVLILSSIESLLNI